MNLKKEMERTESFRSEMIERRDPKVVEKFLQTGYDYRKQMLKFVGEVRRCCLEGQSSFNKY